MRTAGTPVAWASRYAVGTVSAGSFSVRRGPETFSVKVFVIT